MSKEFTMAEVAKHRSDDSLYLVIDGGVYDVTSKWSLALKKPRERRVGKEGFTEEGFCHFAL